MKKLNICLLLIILVLNQSCFVIGTHNGSSWFKKEHTQDGINSHETKLEVIISLERHQAKLIIPFIFIEWYNKNYRLSFNFSTFDSTYKNIDSIKYSILDIDSNLICTNICYGKPFSTFSCLGSSNYRAWMETDYNLIIPKKSKNDLIILFNLYLKKHIGGSTMFKYHFILKRSNKDKWIEAGFFQV